MTKPRVLVIGDAMLDEYVYGDVHRISPEAATPVLSVTRTERMAGGAGNVARGLAALDIPCDFVTVCSGSDEAGRELIAALSKEYPKVTPWIAVEPDRTTTHKTRYVSDQHSSHLLRVDHECNDPISGETIRAVMRHTLHCWDGCNVIVLSDYCKGVIQPGIAQQLIGLARGSNPPEKIVIVDSKQSDVSAFAGATILKINLNELGFKHDPGDDVVIGTARALCHFHDFKHIVVTLGERGLLMVTRGAPDVVHIPGKRVHVRDVSGAGDTVVAMLAAMLAQGASLTASLQCANAAAAIAVSKPGTAVVSTAEMEGGMVAPADDWALLDQRLSEWRGQRIAFANGCFDLLHAGHLHMLGYARAHNDKLIVGINDDDSVRRLKGDNRPVQKVEHRAEILAALDIVDLVVIFTGDDPSTLIKRIRPDTLYKGDDYVAADVAGREYAGSVQFVERLPDHTSTTETIERIKAA
jgi:D-beta-D-heptose 7-phosphate kinase/D-beta-D-heptose 1-phosphate adenosyltransferase